MVCACWKNALPPWTDAQFTYPMGFVSEIKSPIRKQCPWSGSRPNPSNPITMSDHSGSYADTSNSLTDLPGTPKVKNIWR
jgi:hypothetical protein